MSETSDEPQDTDDEGTFVGGSFGGPDDLAGGRSTAAQVEDERERERQDGEGTERLFAAGAGPAAAAEYVTQPSGGEGSLEDVEGPGDTGPVEDVEGTDDTGDVEGTTAEPSPGERNEPV